MRSNPIQRKRTQGGMNAQNGTWLSGDAHCHQAIRDLLTTPKGSRCMRPQYGSRLWEWIDAPLNQETRTEIYAATAEALMRWLPSFELEHIQISEWRPGQVVLQLTGRDRTTDRSLRLKEIRL